jgi:hypothetical protein
MFFSLIYLHTIHAYSRLSGVVGDTSYADNSALSNGWCTLERNECGLTDCFYSSGVGILRSHPLLSRFVTPISLASKVSRLNVPFGTSRVLKKKFLHILFPVRWMIFV